MTDAEKALWRHLRMRQFSGVKFRRQHPIDRYVADFVCIESGLVVEIDGSQHMEMAARDEQRTRSIETHGFRVLRFFDNEVLQHIDAVKEAIWIALAAAPSRECNRPNPHPDLPPERGKENCSPTETSSLPPPGRGRARVGVEGQASGYLLPNLPPERGKENSFPTETALLPPLGRGRAGVGVEHETSPHPHPDLPPARGKE